MVELHRAIAFGGFAHVFFVFTRWRGKSSETAKNEKMVDSFQCVSFDDKSLSLENLNRIATFWWMTDVARKRQKFSNCWEMSKLFGWFHFMPFTSHFRYDFDRFCHHFRFLFFFTLGNCIRLAARVQVEEPQKPRQIHNAQQCGNRRRLPSMNKFT